jgi:hypothetical protein
MQKGRATAQLERTLAASVTACSAWRRERGSRWHDGCSRRLSGVVAVDQLRGRLPLRPVIDTRGLAG